MNLEKSEAFAIGQGIARPRKVQPAAGFKLRTMIHRPPQRAFRLDGERVHPSVLHQFDGKSLYYLLDKAALDGGDMNIFSTEELLRQYRQQIVGARKEGERIHVSLAGEVYLYQNINFTGHEWAFDNQWGNIPDFRKVYPTFWWSTDINDQVSSVSTSVYSQPPGNVWTILYRDINYQGDQLHISNVDRGQNETGPGQISDLRVLGWNDSASSMTYEPF